MLWARALREMKLVWVNPKTTQNLFATDLGYLLAKEEEFFGRWLFTVFLGRFGWRGIEEYSIILKSHWKNAEKRSRFEPLHGLDHIRSLGVYQSHAYYVIGLLFIVETYRVLVYAFVIRGSPRFGAFMAPLTSGRVTIAVSAIYSAKISLAIAIRYSLTRRAFSVAPKDDEVLLLDYPSHQRRLLPLLAKTYALSFAANYLKLLYIKRTPQLIKTIHVVSSALKAILTWHNMRTLQECREACGGQGLKTENRIGQLKGEYDVQSTFEGDNNVLMQQVSKALLAEYVMTRKRNKPYKELGLGHMNKSSPTIPSQLMGSTIRSVQFQNDIFCLRERDLLNRFADEVSNFQSQGKSKESAFNASYQLAEDLGRAFSDRTILHTCIEAENNTTDAHLKKILGLMRSMYVLVTLDEDAAFLRYGYLSTEHAATIRKEVSNLCSEIRPHALDSVTAFGIPDAFLSPIAFDWVAANTWSAVETS